MVKVGLEDDAGKVGESSELMFRDVGSLCELDAKTSSKFRNWSWTGIWKRDMPGDETKF
jgi:hypothetical protein